MVGTYSMQQRELGSERVGAEGRLLCGLHQCLDEQQVTLHQLLLVLVGGRRRKAGKEQGSRCVWEERGAKETERNTVLWDALCEPYSLCRERSKS